MRIKVCGLNKPKNIEALASLPIDFMGFIFYKKSPRFVDFKPEEIDFLKATNIKRVGVFVNAEIDYIFNTVHDYELDFVQLHGTERPEFCAELKDLWSASTIRSAKVIKAFSVDDDFDFSITRHYERFCDLFLFDTKGENPGGNGTTFNWQMLGQYKGMTPFLLSGGLDFLMVDDIKKLQFPQLYGVDINSKFETEPGLKNVTLVTKFAEELNQDR